MLINEKTFLYLTDDELHQYEFDEPNIIKLKEKKEIMHKKVLKYPGNKLITYKKNKIFILG